MIRPVITHVPCPPPPPKTVCVSHAMLLCQLPQSFQLPSLSHVNPGSSDQEGALSSQSVEATHEHDKTSNQECPPPLTACHAMLWPGIPNISAAICVQCKSWSQRPDICPVYPASFGALDIWVSCSSARIPNNF